MFTKNFYRRLWRHWITPTPSSLGIYPSAMFGVPANEYAFALSQISTSNNSIAGVNFDNLGCGSSTVITDTTDLVTGQYIPNTMIPLTSTDANVGKKALTLTETAYNENTFYDQISANAPITNLSFSARATQSDYNVVYDITTDSIKKTYSYTVTNNNATSITVRAITGTRSIMTRQTESGTNIASYLLIWAINLDNPVELLAGESATLTITYRWNNCTPGSQASPYSISASIE